jgi:hypothetical protein
MPYFSAIFVLCLLGALIWMALKAPETRFHEFLVFARTAIGSVTGYYFGGTKRQAPP